MFVKKNQGCELPKGGSFTVKTENRSMGHLGLLIPLQKIDGKVFGPITYRPKEAIYLFLYCITKKEEALRETMADKADINTC